ncbi:MAG: hypothetical protein E6K64_01970 [Nitrospirae bacterium]|nr:MAG: hypothetical protein E6K64_01970 [Nitrospirota bacterium]
MLHRMTMRVVPALTVAVTEEGFRSRKRLVMVVPGLVSFALYRGLKVMAWHEDIVALLCASGLFSSLVALAAYAYGRERRLADVLRDDDLHTQAWVALRIGFLYAVQLSLMVLALLKVGTYDYHDHPDGPAMMALIIASMSVARDAFEIGHIRLLQQQGQPFVTFPDGKALWKLVTGRVDLWAMRVAVATVGVGLVYLALTMLMSAATTDLGQLIVIGVLAGAACTLAFVQGLHPSLRTWEGLTRYSWRELLRFFLWPGMAFGWTYYLIADGTISFLLAVPDPPVWARLLVTAGTAGLLSLYGYYMGRSRWREETLHATIPASLLRCPFISSILASKKA